jgi:subtilisin family serine protease
MKNPFLAIGILSIVLFISCKKDINAAEETLIEDTEYEVAPQQAVIGDGIARYVPNEILVKFKPGLGYKSIARSVESIEGSVTEHILTNAMRDNGDEGIYLIHTPLNVPEARMRMKGNDDILYTEPNYIYQHCGGPGSVNDTYYKNGNLWGMYGTGTDPLNEFGSRAGEAWAKGHMGSAAVYVGVIDEGAMFDHEDLAGQFWTNPFDIADGKDNDGNGYIDDIHGWDFFNNDKTIFDGIDDDHGTHVSGTIGAKGGNRKGVDGVNWNITMISAKFLGSNGGTTANAIKAVDYFTDLKLRHGLNIVATNNSWAGGDFSQSLQDAITRAGNANILFVCGAGNGSTNIDVSPLYPVSYNNSNILSATAIDAPGWFSYFSNSSTTSVDIGAPGSGVYSTVPAIVRGKMVSGYSAYSGTSMATPHVTGAAALYASTHPGATAAEIKSAILNSAIPTASLTGKCVTGGRLNISGF